MFCTYPAEFSEGSISYPRGLCILITSRITAPYRASSAASARLLSFARMKNRLTRVSSSLDFELEREEDDQAVCLIDDEFREGYDAFKSKRAADFVNLPGAAR